MTTCQRVILAGRGASRGANCRTTGTVEPVEGRALTTKSLVESLGRTHCATPNPKVAGSDAECVWGTWGHEMEPQSESDPRMM
jgi:hypothetical protein